METNKPENPSAFPVSSSERLTWEAGMTLKDYFAAKAMASVMIGESYTNVKTAEEVAQWSYAIANAMLKEREDARNV